LELVLGWETIREQVSEIQFLKDETRLPIVLSRVNRNDASKTSGGKYNHLISHGFTIAEIPEITSFIRKNPLLLDGVQFAIPRSVNPWNAARELQAFKNDTNCKPTLYVKSTEASPAQRFDDEIANAIRFSEAVLSGIGFNIDIILDTFDDADRGYFTRTGLIDRRFNPRIAGQLISELIRQLDEGTWKAVESVSPQVINDRGNIIRIGTISEISRDAKWYDPQTGLSGDAASISKVASKLLVIKSRQ